MHVNFPVANLMLFGTENCIECHHLGLDGEKIVEERTLPLLWAVCMLDNQHWCRSSTSRPICGNCGNKKNWSTPTTGHVRVCVCTMSSLVPGIGDEVVLFAAFLVLSVVFIVIISLCRKPTDRNRTQEGKETSSVVWVSEWQWVLHVDTGPRDRGGRQEDDVVEDRVRGDRDGESSAQLRHRGGSAAGNSEREMMTVKLVSLSSTQTVNTSATASINELRRWDSKHVIIGKIQIIVAKVLECKYIIIMYVIACNKQYLFEVVVMYM